MNPEDVDKLFNERLGKLSPKPSAELWNRLQHKMEEERPVQGVKKPVLMWAGKLAVAAAISALLSAGVVFYNMQQEVRIPSDSVTQVKQAKVKEEVRITEQAGNRVDRSIAVAKQEIAPSNAASAGGHRAMAEITKKEPAVALQAPKPVKRVEKKEPPVAERKNTAIAVALPTPAQPEPVKIKLPDTSVSLTSAGTDLNAAPVEIIIKRTVATHETEVEPVEEEFETDFQKKRTLAKNILTQIKNLSNGEQVNLSEVGINANKIALETQIGKQKISKVINL